MTDGTMIRNRPRAREDFSDELADRRPRAFAARTARAARAVGVATGLGVAVAGVFALLAPGQTVRGEDPRLAVAATGDVTGAPAAASAQAEDGPVRGAAPGAVTATLVPPPPELPPAKGLTDAARGTALVDFLSKGGVPVSSGPAKIVRAARNTCSALDAGAVAGDFVADLARVSGYTAVQSTTFFAGATHFYCPRHADDLAR